MKLMKTTEKINQIQSLFFKKYINKVDKSLARLKKIFKEIRYKSPIPEMKQGLSSQILEPLKR